MELTADHRNSLHSATAAPLAVGGLFVVSAAFAARRLTGAFGSPLPAPMLLATVAFFAIVIWWTRIVWLRDGTGGRLVLWGPLAAIVLAMFAFSWPMFRVSDWFAWLPIVAGEVGYLWRGRRDVFPDSSNTILPVTGTAERTAPPRDIVLQQLTRIRNETGTESLFGTLRAEFAPEEQTAVLHIAFCPPLVTTPDVMAGQSTGPDATVRVTQVLPNGVRLEVRLFRPTESPASVVIDFAANEDRE